MSTEPTATTRPASRARARRRGQPQPPPGHGQGVVPARVRAVEPGQRLRRGARRAGVGAQPVQAVRGRPHLADREPAHRGQPAQLPPRDRGAVRPRRRVGHLGAPMDGRGGPARHGHPRLPARHPRSRPGRAGAGPDEAHGGRLRQRLRPSVLDSIAYVSFQELATRVVAPQHRPHQRRPDLRAAARPRSPRTRTCTCCSTATCSARRSTWRRTRPCAR